MLLVNQTQISVSGLKKLRGKQRDEVDPALKFSNVSIESDWPLEGLSA